MNWYDRQLKLKDFRLLLVKWVYLSNQEQKEWVTEAQQERFMRGLDLLKQF